MQRHTTVRDLIASLTVLAMFIPLAAGAAVWTVEQDGTGDFTVIQDAVDAAASGDVIQIGPGVYDETTPYVYYGQLCHAGVLVPAGMSLTLTGAGADATVIGAAEPGTDTMGLVAHDAGDVVVSGVAFQNCHYGGVSQSGVGDLVVTDCAIVGPSFPEAVFAVESYGSGPTELRGCRVVRAGQVRFHSGRTAVVEDCEFEDARLETDGDGTTLVCRTTAFSGSELFQAGIDAVVEQCTFTGSQAQFQGEAATVSTFAMDDCELRDTVVSVVGIFGGTSGVVRRTRASGSPWAFSVVSGASLTISESVIDAPRHVIRVSEATAVLEQSVCTGGEALVQDDDAVGITINACHLLRRDDPYGGHVAGPYFECVRASAARTFDFTGNWWGTTDVEAIRDQIVDCADAPSLPHCVTILPLADGPVPTETRSWSGVKGLFE